MVAPGGWPGRNGRRGEGIRGGGRSEPRPREDFGGRVDGQWRRSVARGRGVARGADRIFWGPSLVSLKKMGCSLLLHGLGR